MVTPLPPWVASSNGTNLKTNKQLILDSLRTYSILSVFNKRMPNLLQKMKVFLQSFKKTQIILFTKAEVNKNIGILISFTDHVNFFSPSLTGKSIMEKKVTSIYITDHY